jgi:hypothetical protein
MPRPNAPWFRDSKNTWYTTIDGRQVSLGVHGKKNRRAALQALARLIAGVEPPRPCSSLKVAELVENFLASAGQRLKPRTVARYRVDAGGFVKLFGGLPADRLTIPE